MVTLDADDIRLFAGHHLHEFLVVHISVIVSICLSDHLGELVWFGLVWFGLVWFGLVWFDLVRFGLVWFGFCLVWFLFGLVWFGLVCLVCLGWAVWRRQTTIYFSNCTNLSV